jgi:hypothetical protein
MIAKSRSFVKFGDLLELARADSIYVLNHLNALHHIE